MPAWRVPGEEISYSTNRREEEEEEAEMEKLLRFILISHRVTVLYSGCLICTYFEQFHNNIYLFT